MGLFSNIKGKIGEIFKPTKKEKTPQKTISAKSLIEKFKPKQKHEKKQKTISAKSLIEKLKPKKIKLTKLPKVKQKKFSVSDYKKAKQQQEQQQPQQIQPEQENVSRETFYDEQDRDIDNHTEPLDFDDANTYINYLIGIIQNVASSVQSELSAIYFGHVNTEIAVAGLLKAQYWLSEALQLPYAVKENIARNLAENNFTDRVEEILSMALYPSDEMDDVETSIDDIGQQIQEIVEGYY